MAPFRCENGTWTPDQGQFECRICDEGKSLHVFIFFKFIQYILFNLGFGNSRFLGIQKKMTIALATLLYFIVVTVN